MKKLARIGALFINSKARPKQSCSAFILPDYFFRPSCLTGRMQNDSLWNLNHLERLRERFRSRIRENSGPPTRSLTIRLRTNGPDCVQGITLSRGARVLIGGNNFAQHRPWIVAVAVLSVLAGVWFVVAGLGKAAWPGGSSVPGFTFGVAGGLIILFEFLLWPRKKARTWRIGQTKTWMRAHIWLGLLTVPLLILHSGLTWGGTLSAVLLLLLLVVVASGVWGLALQQMLPQRMLHDIPAETIHSQIDQ